ncbi:uncharacterized protein LOC129969351 [Argiope bruennichi]|uniref:Uncharacterized protein n=1 Tax=Argiope bruennichi TaxID=94029 RepID=A0A8T0FN65_ARGBR|nr:uncharacterized protein LOC129969351 [Argiope bruennichi]XP_055939868.1 uncharacterized protein LOC129969351 [Argiope bruennichi]KAF8791972.1 hypothetical protein HNY73_003629 [Argiope bruennichi]
MSILQFYLLALALQFIMCGKNLCIDVFLYSYGMVSLILGIAFMIASIDPRPFPIISRWYFIGIGVFLLLNGCCPLVCLLKIPQYPRSRFVIGPQNETGISVTELLDDSQFVGRTDSPIVELREAKFGIEEQSDTEKQSSTTLSSVSTANSGIFFYKETFV